MADIVSTYHAKKQAGLCVARSCKNPAGKYVRCDVHHARSLAYQKGKRKGRNQPRYLAKKIAGICVNNSCNNPATDYVRCNPCQEKERERVRCQRILMKQGQTSNDGAFTTGERAL